METYRETIKRFRILRHEELSEAHKAEYRLNGIDPDNNWSLIWSFDRIEDALATLDQYAHDPNKPKFYRYRMVDGGKTEMVERPAWF